MLISKSSSNVFPPGSVRVMLESVHYIPSDLFYNYITNLMACFNNNIMNILYKSDIYINCKRLLSKYNIVFKYCDICIVNEYVEFIVFIYKRIILKITLNLREEQIVK